MKEHFEEKFVETNSGRPLLDGLVLRPMSMNDSISLEAPFSEEEIKEAVWCCEGSKSSGLDGMSLQFIQRCWHFIRKDILACFKDFHDGVLLFKSITSSFLSNTKDFQSFGVSRLPAHLFGGKHIQDYRKVVS